ncbi:MAG: hypothetical protein IIA65_03600 [Planctomycetes bacterium]|nr:hypothetical protein [Planctomycetota bacterium]
MIKHCFLPLVTTLLLSSILVARDYNIGQARGYPSSHASSYSYAVGQHITGHGTGYVQAKAQGGYAVASSHAHNRGRRHHRPRPIPTPHKMIGHAHGGTHLGLQLHSHLRSSMGLRMISHLSVGRHGHNSHHSQHHYH